MENKQSSGIAGALFGLFIIFVLFLALHKPKGLKKEEKAQEDEKIFQKIRSDLLELCRIILQIKNTEIRLLSNQICQTADKILKTLKEQPEELFATRQFFQYYLPTFRGILSKYQRMEKRYDNLFEDDRLDLTVEMETLTLVCKKDGLLDDEISVPHYTERSDL